MCCFGFVTWDSGIPDKELVDQMEFLINSSSFRLLENVLVFDFFFQLGIFFLDGVIIQSSSLSIAGK